MANSDSLDNTAKAFAKMLGVIKALRAEDGCPWDKKQTSTTFHPYILEEYHELIHALNEGAIDEITDEMGDLIFIVIFTAYLLEQEGVASLDKVISGAVAKMIRRHPHVFGDVEVKDADEVLANWRKIKASEKTVRDRESLLDGIPRSLPGLARAQKLARRAARVGFDWTRPEEVFPKVDEELGELRKAVEEKNPAEIREELGDLLFVTANLARQLDIDGETALNETSDKFERRFRYIEASLKQRGRTLEEASLEEMDAFWDEAKALEKKRRQD
jgi:MazG family protein